DRDVPEPDRLSGFDRAGRRALALPAQPDCRDGRRDALGAAGQRAAVDSRRRLHACSDRAAVLGRPCHFPPPRGNPCRSHLNHDVTLIGAIEPRGPGKQYVRGAAHHRGVLTLRDALAEWAGRTVGNSRSARSAAGTERFWALKDVSFAIEPGEVVGIIGRNGSGKSTLLKIVSQITAPTVGEVRLNGRTGTLLEVGTGFHLELTGRENVFLNGTILGMHRAEIARKFDEIVTFSGVEDFIDTPVKRYSSGMQMRLAFAVAAHLDPEILVIDEVLAVGDAEFQKKCLGKMEDLSRTGRTILFVSHNMNAIDQLCSRVIWVNGGAVIEDSRDAFAVTTRYLFGEEGTSALKAEWRPPADPALDTEYFS